MNSLTQPCCEEEQFCLQKDETADGYISVLALYGLHQTRRFPGKANLEKTDLEPALKALQDRLMTKNVVLQAEEIAV
ncbi:hypothetical protein RND71_006629 [Anisodus tanguticus]|uniref:Uncharacterized protein n=1 Tax=Anisodus tanguticus TaxID=243964 RepID=A0AAE1VNU3_9SOLA|nr:hypothetical protein RND71_006629 [Anisodus tanguticus]